MTDANELRMNISMMAPGTSVNLKVLRNGANSRLNGDVGRTSHGEDKAERQSSDSKSELSGISVQDVDARTARQLGVPANTAGVVVTGVDPSSAAADSGLGSGRDSGSES